MSVLGNLRTQLAKIGNRILGKPMSLVRGIFSLSTQEVWDNIDKKDAVEKGFGNNIQTYVIVRKAAHKFGSIPRYVYANDTKEQKSFRKSVLWETKALTRLTSKRNGLGPTIEELIDRPNPFISQDLFFAQLYAYFKVCGNAYIWCNRGDISDKLLPDGSFDHRTIDKMPVLEMYVLPSHLVTIIGQEDNAWGIDGYILETINRPVMRRQDVVHWRDINLEWSDDSRSQLMGMSPLTPGSKTLEESNSISKASMRMSQNDGSKALIFDKSLRAPDPMKDSQVKAVIDRKFNNVDTAGAVAAMQGDWGLINLAVTSKDMEMIEKKKMSWQEMALLLDMPPELVVTDQKYDNAGKAMLQWVYNLIPYLKQLDAEMSRVLMPSFNLKDTAFIGSDVTELPEVREQMINEAKALQDIWSVAPNDVREGLGYDRLPDTRFDEPWVINGRQPLSEMSMQDELQSEIDMLNAANRAGNRNNSSQ